MDALIPRQRPTAGPLARLTVVPTAAVDQINRRLDRIERKLDALIQRMEIDMSELDAELTDIETAEAAEHADIERVITDLEAKDQAGTLTDDERTRLEALKAEIAADTAAIDAADPAPPAA